ncbi:hypothetical protein CTRI78_v005144 [Colletotrichum trifolii]|uniref:Uncharacterized protein n=1 Tax=Colletotrichum trifolii TaxID=5466 RepID=A0A4R8RFH8_COLTR|nr:hypothetical protein CTRI78_v005144 [Colletotrichum trifolii]
MAAAILKHSQNSYNQSSASASHLGAQRQADRKQHHFPIWLVQLATRLTLYLFALYGAVSLILLPRNLVSRDSEASTPTYDYISDTASRTETINCFSCGFTSSEAISRGCIWEEMDMQWLHPLCVDTELQAEYGNKGQGPDGVWMFETEGPNTNGSGPFLLVNSTELSLLVEPGRKAWSTVEHHLLHCNYRWRKQFRTKHTGVHWPMPRGKEAHVAHCGQMSLMRDVPLQQYRTRVLYPGPKTKD